jgi:mannose-6-phosphate isomerase-like protein (cupin superfamily)
MAMKPIRRVVTGNDAQGRSKVLWDSAAPNANPRPDGLAGMTDVWVYPGCPVDLSVERDDGAHPFHFEPPHQGGHLRIVHSTGKPADYDAAKDPQAVAPHPPKAGPGGTMYRGGQNFFSSPVHKSQTVDYGIVLEGERVLVLDDGERVMRKGDVVVQVGNWHGWTNSTGSSLMAFVMMGGKDGD